MHNKTRAWSASLIGHWPNFQRFAFGLQTNTISVATTAMAKLGGARPVETTPCLGNSHRKWQNWLEVETVADRRYNVQNFNFLPQGSEDMKSISTITAQNSMGSDISQPQQVTKEEVKMWTINGSHSSEHTTTGVNFEGKINQPTLWTQPWTNLFCLDLGGARPCESITQLQSGATRKVSFVWIGVLSHLSTQLAQKKCDLQTARLA